MRNNCFGWKSQKSIIVLVEKQLKWIFQEFKQLKELRLPFCKTKVLIINWAQPRAIFLCILLLKRLYSFCFCLSCFAGGGHQGPRSMWAPSIWPPMMQSIMSSVNCGNRRIVHIAHFRSCLILNWTIWQPKLTNSWCKCTCIIYVCVIFMDIQVAKINGSMPLLIS